MTLSKRSLLKAGALASMTAIAAPGFATSANAAVPGSGGHALLAIWYDVAAGHEAKYLAWAHSEYFPALARRKGYLWATHYRILGDQQQHAVDGHDNGLVSYTAKMRQIDQSAAEYGHGHQFLILLGAQDPTAFLSPYHANEDAAMGGAAKAMLALREGMRTTMFADVVRQAGPAADMQFGSGMPSPRIQLGGLRTTNNTETNLWRWYVDERFPVLAKLEGMVSARLLSGLTGWERYGVLYEFADKASHARFRHAAEQVTLDGATSGKSLFPAGHVVQSPNGPTIADRIWPAT